MSDNFNKKRLIKNSTTLYIRMMFTMVLNLLTTRFVLSNLGVEDMGVFSVVGSIVNMFAIFISGLLSAAQRFITFEMGKKDGNIALVFSTCSNIILAVSVLLFLLLEIGGLWMLNCNVNLPEQSKNAAKWVLQFSIFTCLLNLNSTCYNAILIAHEKMNIWAFISTLQVLLGCVAAYCISYFPNNDRLIYYSLLGLLVQFFIRLLYFLYCIRHFPETKFSKKIDVQLVKSIAKYTGASSVSGLLQVFITQGLVLIINWTYGVAINAVYNIGLQVKNSVLSFGMNIFKAVQPQITKTYAAGEFNKHEKLVYSGSKIGSYMIMIILIPFCFHSHYIMKLWLGTVPPYASSFAMAFVFQSLLYASFEPFRTAALATGNVVKFFIYSELIHSLVLPLAYYWGAQYETPIPLIIIIVAMEFVYCASMIVLGSKVSIPTINGIFRHVVVPCFLVGIVSAIPCYFISLSMEDNIGTLIFQLVLGSIIFSIVVLLIGINQHERRVVMQVVNAVKIKIGYK